MARVRSYVFESVFFFGGSVSIHLIVSVNRANGEFFSSIFEQ